MAGVDKSQQEETTTEEPGRRGWQSLFVNKVRAPVSLTLTRKHHRQIKAATKRLRITRSDAIGLLIELYADGLTVEDKSKVA